jgi:hypothetical protein
MTYVAKVNADAPGGLEAIGAPFVSTAAKSYSFHGG